MTDTQKYLLKLLLEIDEICKKHDIEYVIDYGTTLGAVRHEGFIPWDDDIDIMMTEDNYYKWVEACKTELDPSKRVYCDGRLNREYPCVFGRYLDVTSARIGRTSFFWEPICGQGIDVFVLLPLPGDPVKKQEAIDLYFAYDEYSNGSYRHYRFKTEKWMQLINSFREEEKKVGKQAVLDRLEKEIFHRHYDDCDTYIVNSARKIGPPSVVPKYCYDNIVMADFEGYKFPIAGKYIDLMNVYYEDTYCMIPPEPKRHVQMSHTGYGCKLYVDDYMRYLKKDKVLTAIENTKYADVEEGYRITRLHKQVYDKVGKLVRLKLEQKVKKDQINVKDYMVANDPKKLAVLEELFGEYYKKQMDKSVRSWESYLDIGDELLEAALFNLLYLRNDYYSIAKILYLRETAGLPKTKLMEELWDCIVTVRRIKAETIYGNFTEAHKYAEKGLKLYPDCNEIKISAVLLDVCEAKEDISVLEAKVTDLYEKNKEEDQCIKAMGDIAYLKGDIAKAKEYYTVIMENSKNGMLHLDINRKMRAIGEDIVQVKYFEDEMDAPAATPVKEGKTKPTPVQEHILTLMDEIDEICKKNGLHYILHNRTAGRAVEYGCFTDDTYQFEILMPYKDVMNFKRIVEKEYKNNRTVEDLSVNTDMKQMMFRYVDKNTLLVDAPSGNFYKAPGVCVTIYTTRTQRASRSAIGTERYLQLQNNDGAKMKYSGKEIVAMQKEIEEIGPKEMAKKYKDPKIEEFLKNTAGIDRGMLIGHLGKKFSAKWVLKKIEKDEDKAQKSEFLWYMKRNGGWLKLERSLYDNPKRISFSGHEYYVAGQFEEYLKKMFGKNYKKASLVPYRSTNNIRALVETELPYEEYLSYLKGDKDLRSLILEWQDYNIWLKETHKPISDVSYHMIHQMMRSVHRIDVWYRAQAKREDMKKAYEAKDLEALRELMAEYLERTDYFYDLKVGFYIDEELFDYAKMIWEADGREGYADKVYALVPDFYRTERVEDWVKKYY